MSLISRVKIIFKSKGKEVGLSSKDTAKTMLEKDAVNNIAETLSKDMFKSKYPKQIDMLLSYGLTRRQAKRYLKVKYIYKHTKKGRTRLKANKMLGSFCFNDMYKGEEL